MPSAFTLPLLLNGPWCWKEGRGDNLAPRFWACVQGSPVTAAEDVTVAATSCQPELLTAPHSSGAAQLVCAMIACETHLCMA